MSTTTTTPNMNLIVPTPGQDPGPTYATDINSSLSIIDQHNHTPGNGVAITPTGLNLNSNVNFLSNSAQYLASCQLTSQSGKPVTASGLGCLYSLNGELYYSAGSGGSSSTPVQITNNGSIAGASGNITGLASPASVVYSSVGGSFTFQSNTNVAATMYTGPINIADVAASANSITIASPTGLANGYGITLLPSLPGSTSFLTIDSSAEPWC